MNKESYHIVGTTHIKNYGYIEFNPCEGRLRLIMNFSPNSNRIRGKVKRLFDAISIEINKEFCMAIPNKSKCSNRVTHIQHKKLKKDELTHNSNDKKEMNKSE